MVVPKKSFDEQISYLDLVEEHLTDSPISLFEKVLIMSNRARDLYSGRTSRLGVTTEGGKPTAVAQYEVLKGMIEPQVTEKEEKPDEFMEETEYE